MFVQAWCIVVWYAQNITTCPCPECCNDMHVLSGQFMQGSGVYNVAAWPGAALTGIWRKMDFFKPMAVIMNILVRVIGMSARNGSKPLAYACLASQSELEGMVHIIILIATLNAGNTNACNTVLLQSLLCLPSTPISAGRSGVDDSHGCNTVPSAMRPLPAWHLIQSCKVQCRKQ